MTTLYEVIYHQNLELLFTDEVVKKALVVHGEKDEVAPLKNIKGLSKRYGLELKILQNEGHGIPNEAKEKIYTILEELDNSVPKKF